MRIAREEVFGPGVAVIIFETEEEAVKIANDSNYGLAAGLWTENLGQAMRLAEELEAGVVWVNTYRKSSFTTLFGGKKDSGVGVEKGIDAIDEYLTTKSVRIRREGDISDPFTLM